MRPLPILEAVCGSGICAAARIVILVGCLTLAIPMTAQTVPSTPGNEIRVLPIDHELRLDAQHPAADWDAAASATFSSDWQGSNSDPARQTAVRALWSATTLYLRFVCRYRELFTFPNADPHGRRDHLWDRDVAEVFLQPDPARPRYYKEFEIAPNGYWIDLDISPGPLQDLKSGMQSSVWLDHAAHTWSAELAIPFRAMIGHFDPAAVWRANFYRIEGSREPRFYSAWQPTHTPQPNFHVPSAFGYMRFLRTFDHK